MQPVIILGSTGSIGTQALDVCYREQIPVLGLAAGGSQLELLAAQVRATGARIVAIADDAAAAQARDLLASLNVELLIGPDAPAKLAAHAEADHTVLNGITGAVGLDATLAALATGARVALANKESLVVGGPLVRQALVRPGQIVPVDSEHSAMFQALQSGSHRRGLCCENPDVTREVDRLVLTASGGPFRGKTRADLANVTPAEALDHPTWSMGPVVTINSSTLMNKALEFIEAHLLFDIAPSDIDVVIHPQSVIHSMVTFRDGATIAQASPPDMRLPIALALTWPERRYPAPQCRWDQAVTWTFEPVDHETFPALSLAREALAASPTHPAVLNAANEVCVDQFLAGQLEYLAIVDTVAEVLAEHQWASNHHPSRADIAEVDAWARRRAAERCA
ncbi:MAG: 1-deoxy-D-xylulose-5-phosphate reductoisomerase [Bowdeniella nasicola]|nr:1-deoxy-D-xylulose-5-phosphate reductoisomerase [Bowdeniella nasicola]